jgi:TPR repeat protein
MRDPDSKIALVPAKDGVLALSGTATLARRGLSDLQRLESAKEWSKKAFDALIEGQLGVEGKLEESIGCLQHALELDPHHAEAQTMLGDAYCSGSGVAQDYAKAEEWYRKAAIHGYAAAQRMLGWTYESGNGVAKDLSQAAGWYRIAAEQGNAEAQLEIARIYENGMGVTHDLNQAAAWYRKAADQGIGNAARYLRLFNREGVPRDLDQVASKFFPPAVGKLAAAQHKLGWMFLKGEGVNQDSTQAAAWIYLASLANEIFKSSWHEVSRRLTSKCIADAKIMAHDWLEARAKS